MTELEEINNKLARVCASVQHIKEHVEEMRAEREKHKDTFWFNMNSMKDNLRDEQEARKLADQDIKGEVSKLKVKIGTISAGIAIGISMATRWIMSQFK